MVNYKNVCGVDNDPDGSYVLKLPGLMYHLLRKSCGQI